MSRRLRASSRPGSTFADALAAWHAKREGKQVIDIGFHIAVTDLREGGSLEELARLPEQGVTSYKLFMAYKGALMVDDETLFRTMEVAAETGALVMVHAENGDAIDVLVKQALAAGNTAPHFHALTRPPELEGEATNRAIQLARIAGAPLYVVHVSCREAVEPIARRARAGLGRLGRDLHAVLLHRLHVPRAPGLRGCEVRLHAAARDRSRTRTCSGTPCARTSSRSISTDHCAFLWDGQKTLGRDDFSKIPNGGPGLENRLHMIHEFGVRTGRISLNRMVELLSHEPGEALRPLSAQGHDRAGLRRRHRRSSTRRSEQLITAADQHSKIGLQPLRGHRGHRVVRDRPDPRNRARRAAASSCRAGVRASSSSVPRFGQELLPAAAR